MKKYKIDKDQNQLSDKELSKFKDFSKLSASYEKMTRRPKPLYRNPKAFFVLAMIAVVAWLVAEGVFDKKDVNINSDPTLMEQKDSVREPQKIHGDSIRP